MEVKDNRDCLDFDPDEPVETYGDNTPCWIKGYVDTDAGRIPKIDSFLEYRDILGSWMVRWNIGRMHYTVLPGIYALGNPDKSSPVLVTANYKLTFDMLRKELKGISAWIMAIDTKGINVWCAAGKGTFGTAEVIKRIKLTHLNKLVSHRKIILPQLGASGVAFHTVLKMTGFRVAYGPVRASDIPAFLESGMKATNEMRRVNFTMWNRLVLTPVEITASFKILGIILLVLLGLNIISGDRSAILQNTVLNFIPYAGAAFIGTVLVPVFLPYIPVRPFSLKGCILGTVWAAIVSIFPEAFMLPQNSLLHILSNFLILPAISAFLAFNFTGSTTYTSLSGVRKEMKYSAPLMAAAAALGSIMLLAAKAIEIFRG